MDFLNNFFIGVLLVMAIFIIILPFTHIFLLNSYFSLRDELYKKNNSIILKKMFKILLLSLVVLLPIIIFIYHFASHSFSNDISKWGAFGDYIGGVYSVYISIGLFLLSRKLGKTDERRNKQRLHIEKLYGMIRSINNNGTLNVSMFADFVNEIASAELYLSKNIIIRMINLQDNYAEASDNPEVLNMELETEVLGMLKDELKRI